MALFKIQAFINNTISTTTGRTPNKIIYKFLINQSTNLLAAIPKLNSTVRIEVRNTISMT